jgi:hypothetical protein
MKRFFAVLAMSIALLGVPLAGNAKASPTSEGSPLPACSVEDGNGVALCIWDGVVSGDCAPDYVGGFDVSRECVAMHDFYKKAVEECVEEWNMYDPSDPSYKGFTFQQCIEALK